MSDTPRLIRCTAIALLCGAALTAAQAEVGISDPPETHHFGSIPLGASYATQYFSLFNNGSSPVTLGVARIDGELATCAALGCPVVAPADFQIDTGADGCSGHTLQPGQGCSTLVGFVPSEPGARMARLVFTIPGSPPVTRTLQGNGSSQPLDCVLDWAQAQWPDILRQPSHTFAAEQFLARCYANNSLCVGADNRYPTLAPPSVYVLNLQGMPSLSNLGPLSQWAAAARCR